MTSLEAYSEILIYSFSIMCRTLQVRLKPPALSIQALYPLSSLSICCWRRSFMKALRFSTLSLSLANSLKSQTRPQKHIFALQDPGILSYIRLHLGGIHWMKIQYETPCCSVNHEENERDKGALISSSVEIMTTNPPLTSPQN